MQIERESMETLMGENVTEDVTDLEITNINKKKTRIKKSKRPHC
jgi:hypothetical protein